jgi:hypothetical protein
MPRKDGHKIVVMGASAGGLRAVSMVLQSLPRDFAAAIFVVIHTGPRSPGLLPGILSRAGPLTARFPSDGEAIVPGRVYVAPPNRHLVLAPDRRVRLDDGPLEHGARPAVDPLFRSAARVFGSRAVGVVLSGGGDDGAVGLATIKAAGGVAVVQEPSEAEQSGMPREALAADGVDFRVPLAEMPPLLVRLCGCRNTASTVAAAGAWAAAPHHSAESLDRAYEECRRLIAANRLLLEGSRARVAHTQAVLQAFARRRAERKIAPAAGRGATEAWRRRSATTKPRDGQP